MWNRVKIWLPLALTLVVLVIANPATATVLDGGLAGFQSNFIRTGVPFQRGRLGRLLSKIGNEGKQIPSDLHLDQIQGATLKSCAEPRLSLRGGEPFYTESASPNRLQIVFLSAEVAPWSVTGGLGAVCDGLPRALAKQGHRVMSIAPRYDQYYDAWDTEFTAEVPLGEGTTTVRFFHAFKKGVDRVFVDHPIFLEKVWGLTKTKLYGPKWGQDYEDNQLRFTMFCKAALVATEQLSLGGFPYGQDVVFVANDWHAALLPMYLRQAQAQGSWQKTKSALLLHNLVFQVCCVPFHILQTRCLRFSIP